MELPEGRQAGTPHPASTGCCETVLSDFSIDTQLALLTAMDTVCDNPSAITDEATRISLLERAREMIEKLASPTESLLLLCREGQHLARIYQAAQLGVFEVLACIEEGMALSSDVVAVNIGEDVSFTRILLAKLAEISVIVPQGDNTYGPSPATYEFAKPDARAFMHEKMRKISRAYRDFGGSTMIKQAVHRKEVGQKVTSAIQGSDVGAEEDEQKNRTGQEEKGDELMRKARRELQEKFCVIPTCSDLVTSLSINKMELKR